MIVFEVIMINSYWLRDIVILRSTLKVVVGLMIEPGTCMASVLTVFIDWCGIILLVIISSMVDSRLISSRWSIRSRRSTFDPDNIFTSNWGQI